MQGRAAPINLGDLSGGNVGNFERPTRPVGVGNLDVAGYLHAAAQLGLSPTQSLQLGLAAGLAPSGGAGAGGSSSWLTAGSGATAGATPTTPHGSLVQGAEGSAAPALEAPPLASGPPTAAVGDGQGDNNKQRRRAALGL